VPQPPCGGRRTTFWVREERRLVNHDYFYLRDREYGEGFVRISSYAPFHTRIWLNAHGYLAAQLRRRRVAFRKLDNCPVNTTASAGIASVSNPDAALPTAPARIHLFIGDSLPRAEWLVKLLPAFAAPGDGDLRNQLLAK
jgi:hypothetical protein